MEIITAFLNTPLYSPSTEAHVPSGAVSISGSLVSRDASGIQLQATTYRNARGKERDGSPTNLFVPMHKIDHLLLDG